MYNKFYSKDGTPCTIKISKKFLMHEMDKVGRILIRFRHKNDLEWMYHAPSKEFISITDIMSFILENLDHEGMQFKISPVVDNL